MRNCRFVSRFSFFVYRFSFIVCRFSFLVFGLSFLVSLAGCSADSSPHRLTIVADTIYLHRADGSSTIKVYTGNTLPADSSTPVLGELQARKATIRFVPRFPSVPGQQYFVRATTNDTTIDTTFALPPRQGEPTTVVERIFPSADQLPVNLLRIYVQFSAPMRIGDAQNHIKLIDASGQEVEGAFLVPPQELWDSEKQRLTLLFDPGRIKRGVRPNVDLGLPLQSGRRYRIVVDTGYRDAYGNRLKQEYVKEFRVGPEVRALVDVKDWKITPPSAQSPLIIDFPRPLDHGLLLRMISVRGVTGHILIERDETRWIFRADQPWRPGDYLIEVNTELEDPAGNNLRDVFDVDRNRPVRGTRAGVVTLSFQVEPERPLR